MPGAGDLDHRLEFSRRGAVDDGYGNPVSGPFEAQFTIWAGLKPLRGGEKVTSDRLAGVQPVIITVRMSSKTRLITTGWQAKDIRSGVVYDITAAADMEGRRQFIDIMATAGVAQA